MTSKEIFWERKEKLNQDFSFAGSVADPATPEQIEQYEKTSGYTFSEDFKDFLTTFGSLIFEVKEEIWKRPALYDVLPAWKFGYGFFVYGLSQDEQMPDWMKYDVKNKEVLEQTEKPIGQLFFRRSGNLYRAYTNNGVINIAYDKDDSDTQVFNGNLYDFLISEIDKLEEDYNKYVKEQKPTS